ncbi:uncharacterized protein HKW66_Vig0001220 [Vigna angularis]|uniref:Uncharacterized protein n=1 Tax=Phaseolus angularis TaxID=3914 RepID=A0A8T0LBP2_PHAAN|nr:uncharacterized protein HKW66_Vig0001220 [Vigna angularis]
MRSGRIVGDIHVDTTDEGYKIILLKVLRYEWATHKVREYAICCQWGNDIVDLVDQTYNMRDDIDDDVSDGIGQGHRPLRRGMIKRMQEELDEEAPKDIKALNIKLNWQLSHHLAQAEDR